MERLHYEKIVHSDSLDSYICTCTMSPAGPSVTIKYRRIVYPNTSCTSPGIRDTESRCKYVPKRPVSAWRKWSVQTPALDFSPSTIQSVEWARTFNVSDPGLFRLSIPRNHPIGRGDLSKTRRHTITINLKQHRRFSGRWRKRRRTGNDEKTSEKYREECLNGSGDFTEHRPACYWNEKA